MLLTLGVDAHERAHEAVALDEAGREIGRQRVPNSAAGWRDLLGWATEPGASRRLGIEGPGEMCFVRDGGTAKRYRYRAIDEQGQVLAVRLRDHRDTASAEAFFRRMVATTGVTPATVIGDHHHPSIKAVQEVFPGATHLRTGRHRARGETTGGVERRHIATRDRRRSSRGLETLATGQRFFEAFEADQALGDGHTRPEPWSNSCRSTRLPGPRPMTGRRRWPRLRRAA